MMLPEIGSLIRITSGRAFHRSDGRVDRGKGLPHGEIATVLYATRGHGEDFQFVYLVVASSLGVGRIWDAVGSLDKGWELLR